MTTFSVQICSGKWKINKHKNLWKQDIEKMNFKIFSFLLCLRRLFVTWLIYLMLSICNWNVRRENKLKKTQSNCQIRKTCENETSKNWISRFPVFSFVWEVVSNWMIWQENKKWFSWQTAYNETSSLKMIRLRLGLFLFFAISSSFGQNQGLIDDNSLDLALRNVIQYIESGSNSLYAYKVGHVRIFSICNLIKSKY